MTVQGVEAVCLHHVGSMTSNVDWLVRAPGDPSLCEGEGGGEPIDDPGGREGEVSGPPSPRLTPRDRGGLAELTVASARNVRVNVSLCGRRGGFSAWARRHWGRTGELFTGPLNRVGSLTCGFSASTLDVSWGLHTDTWAQDWDAHEVDLWLGNPPCHEEEIQRFCPTMPDTGPGNLTSQGGAVSK